MHIHMSTHEHSNFERYVGHASAYLSARLKRFVSERIYTAPGCPHVGLRHRLESATGLLRLRLVLHVSVCYIRHEKSSSLI
jgi:hypothetical protein